MASGAGSVLGLPTFLALHHPSWILFPLDHLPSLRDLSQVKNLCHSISISTPPSARPAAKPRDFTPKNSCCIPCVLSDENPPQSLEKRSRDFVPRQGGDPHTDRFLTSSARLCPAPNISSKFPTAPHPSPLVPLPDHTSVTKLSSFPIIFIISKNHTVFTYKTPD